MQALLDIIERGSHADLLAAIAGFDDKQRKAAAAAVLAQWKEHDKARSFPHPRQGSEAFALWSRLLVVLTATAADAKKALAIPVPHVWREHGLPYSTEAGEAFIGTQAMAALAEAAIQRGPVFCEQLLALVTDARKPRPWDARLLLLVAQAHGLPLPAKPILAEKWASSFFRLLPRETRGAEPEPDYPRSAPAFTLQRQEGGWRVQGRDETVHGAAQALRLEPAPAAMLLSLFDHRDAVGGLVGRYGGAHATEQAVATVTQLVAEAAVDGAALARQAIAALSRGDAVSCQRLQARLLLAAAPASALVAEQAQPLANLLGSGTGVAAGVAQQLLRGADACAALPDATFISASQMVFARKEKGLRQDQLAWARQRATQPATCVSAALAFCEAMLCADHALQKEAVAALQALWPGLPEAAQAAVRAQVEAAQAALDPGLHHTLWAAVGGATPPLGNAPAAPQAEPRRTGMPKQAFEPVADPQQLPAEVLQALGAWRGDRDGLHFERALQALTDAVGAADFAAAQKIARRVSIQQPFDKEQAPLAHLACKRVDEVMHMASQRQPFGHVSTPSYSHGAIAPAHLVARLAALASVKQEAPPLDLLLALLRTEACDTNALAALRAVGSAQADVAAHFLAAGGTAQWQTRWLEVERSREAPQGRWRGNADWCRGEGREVCVALSSLAVPPAVPGLPQILAAGFEPADAPYASEFDAVSDWTTFMLPNHAEVLAALQLWGYRRAGMEYDSDGGKNIVLRLPHLLAAHGPAGPALHLAVFFALSANDATARMAGSDGLLTLLQQERFDAALAGELLAACVRCGSVKPGRLAAGLTQVRAAGEDEAVWGLLRATLPAALGLSPVPPATADLVELAIQTVHQTGNRPAIAEVSAAALAVKGKPTKLQVQLLRLHECLSK